MCTLNQIEGQPFSAQLVLMVHFECTIGVMIEMYTELNLDPQVFSIDYLPNFPAVAMGCFK